MEGEDSIDRVEQDVFQEIRRLEKKQAFYSVFLIVDSFLAIAETFGINPTEYEYYLEKYQESSVHTSDLPKNAIIHYLTSLIQRLEAITGNAFDPAKLKIHEVQPESQVNLEEPIISPSISSIPVGEIPIAPPLQEKIEQAPVENKPFYEDNELRSEGTLFKKVWDLKSFSFKNAPPDRDYRKKEQ